MLDLDHVPEEGGQKPGLKSREAERHPGPKREKCPSSSLPQPGLPGERAVQLQTRGSSQEEPFHQRATMSP